MKKKTAAKQTVPTFQLQSFGRLCFVESGSAAVRVVFWLLLDWWKWRKWKRKGQTVATFQLQRSGRLCFVESGLVAVRCENPAEMHLVRKIRSGKTESRPPHQEGWVLRGQKGVTTTHSSYSDFYRDFWSHAGNPSSGWRLNVLECVTSFSQGTKL